MTTLVIQPMKLGDLVQSTPLLSELRKEPGPLVLAAARPEVAEAARLSGLADEVVLLRDGPGGGLAALGGPPSPGSLPERPDILVNLSSSPAALAFLGHFRPRAILGPRSGPNGPELPRAQRLAAAVMAVCRPLGRLNLVDLWRLLSPAGARASRILAWPLPGGALDRSSPPLPEGPGPLVGLHLGSGNHLRRWPVERFAALAQGLGPARLVLLGSHGERSLARRFLDLWAGPRPTDLSGRTSLRQLGQVLARLDLLVSADTGVMHMAASAGAKVLAVFGGPALAGETGPYAPGSVMVQGHCPCAPCAESRQCPARPCPALPAAGPVLAEAMALLGREAPGGQAADRAAPDGPAGCQAYAAGTDELGQTILPARPAPLTDRERLAMALREASAGYLSPHGRSFPGPGWGRNCLPGPGLSPASALAPTIRAIAARGIEDRAQASAFLDQAMAALELLDLAVGQSRGGPRKTA